MTVQTGMCAVMERESLFVRDSTASAAHAIVNEMTARCRLANKFGLDLSILL